MTLVRANYYIQRKTESNITIAKGPSSSERIPLPSTYLSAPSMQKKQNNQHSVCTEYRPTPRAWVPRLDRPSRSSLLPWYRPLLRWWRMTWDATRAGWERSPCRSYSPEPSLWLEGQVHALCRLWGCFHCLKSYGTAPHQQQCWSVGLQCGSRKQ